jgi:hypothetical protein
VSPRFRELLTRLCAAQVEYIVVGGVAAVLEGAPVSTFDLDVVPSRAPDNAARLASALASMDARYRDPEGRVLRVREPDLLGPGHHLLVTNLGPLDVLGTIGHGRDYTALLPHTTRLALGDLQLLVLDLPTQIAVKRELGRDKDRAVLATLEATLAMRERT